MENFREKIDEYIKNNKLKEGFFFYLFYFEILLVIGVFIYSLWACFFKENIWLYMGIIIADIILGLVFFVMLSNKLNSYTLNLAKMELIEFEGLYAHKLRVYKVKEDYFLIFELHPKSRLFLEYHIDNELFEKLKRLKAKDNFVFLKKDFLINRFEYSLDYMSGEEIPLFVTKKEEIIDENKEDKSENKKKNKKKQSNK